MEEICKIRSILAKINDANEKVDQDNSYSTIRDGVTDIALYLSVVERELEKNKSVINDQSPNVSVVKTN